MKLKIENVSDENDGIRQRSEQDLKRESSRTSAKVSLLKNMVIKI